MTIHVTDQNWEETLKNNVAVVADFSATWCGPCRMLAPKIDAAAEAYAGRIAVCKVDVEECPEISEKYSIRNVPTVLYFKNGELVDKTVGAIDQATLTAKFEALL